MCRAAANSEIFPTFLVSKATGAVMQTENDIFITLVLYSAFSLQFCLVWTEKEQDLDNHCGSAYRVSVI